MKGARSVITRSEYIISSIAICSPPYFSDYTLIETASVEWTSQTPPGLRGEAEYQTYR